MSAEFDQAMQDVRERFAGVIQVIPQIALRGVIREDAPHFIRTQLMDLEAQIETLKRSATVILVGYAQARGWDGNTNTIHYDEETGVITVTPIPADSVLTSSAYAARQA